MKLHELENDNQVWLFDYNELDHEAKEYAYEQFIASHDTNTNFTEFELKFVKNKKYYINGCEF
jgi:hypothetical protein